MDASLRRLVDLALASDESSRLVAAAGSDLRCPLALIGPAGEPLGWAPDDERGRRGLAVARAAARSSLVPPPGWHVLEIAHRSSRLGLLAVGGEQSTGAAGRELLDLLVTLLADQLRRAELVRLHAGAFVRRLVTDPPLAPHRARREAAELGISLADTYQVALVVWRAGAVRSDALELLERDARGMVPEAMTTLLNGQLVLLHPVVRGSDAAAAADWFERVTSRIRRVAPASRARGIAHESPAELGDLSRAVASLAALTRFGDRARDDPMVTWTREYALDRLLSREVRATSAIAFVRDQVGALEDWDRRHGTDLLRLLEAALDYPRHEEAAQRCYVHRNTFRHRLRQALDILGDPLEDADVRLAVHVALKLRHLISEASREELAARRSSTEQSGRAGAEEARRQEPGRVRPR